MLISGCGGLLLQTYGKGERFMESVISPHSTASTALGEDKRQQGSSELGANWLPHQCKQDVPNSALGHLGVNLE